MKKVLLCLILLSSACGVFAQPLVANLKSVADEADCDLAKEICVKFRGDNQLIQAVPATFKLEAFMSGGEPYVDLDYNKIGAYTSYQWSVNVPVMKDTQVTSVAYNLIEIDRQPMSNCGIVKTGSQITPGFYLFEISKTANGYSCQRIS